MTIRIKKYMITIAAQKTINLNIENFNTSDQAAVSLTMTSFGIPLTALMWSRYGYIIIRKHSIVNNSQIQIDCMNIIIHFKL